MLVEDIRLSAGEVSSSRRLWVDISRADMSNLDSSSVRVRLCASPLWFVQVLAVL